ncbi:aspartic peptidase domain-containing protein [Zopfochytrium polystomum]|nr:aspartic peptidase domain-containing protein [Zopfochytrium polystomum]
MSQTATSHHHNPAVAPLSLPIGVIESYHYVNLSLGTTTTTTSSSSSLQTVKLEFDTGSGPIWVLDPTCEKSCHSAYQFPRGSYNVSASPSGKQTSQYLSISYVGGYIGGYVSSDNATLCDSACPDGASPSQRASCTDVGSVRFIDVVYSSWSSLATAGFLGLSPPAQADGGTSIYSAVSRKSVVPTTAVGIYLGSANSDLPSNANPKNNGLLTFGASKESAKEYLAHGETIHWIKGDPDYQGNLTLFMSKIVALSFSIKSASPIAAIANASSSPTTSPIQTGTFNLNNSYAIFDTGAGLLSTPASITTSLYAALGFNYTFISHGGRPLCSDVAAVDANLTFTFASAESSSALVNVTVSAKDLATPGYTEDQYCWPVFNDWQSENFLLGKTFLKSFYSLFDIGAFYGDGEPVTQTRMAFAKLREDLKPAAVVV